MSLLRPQRHRYPPHLEDEVGGVKLLFLYGWEVFKVAAMALAIIIPVRYFLIQPFYVKGASMEPNYFDHEYLIIDELTYRFNDPQRGEAVVFRYPGDPRQFFIKRVIGLPGERVVIREGTIYLASVTAPELVAITEPYLPEGLETRGEVDVVLGFDEYYLMGDNRNSSLDSRAFGPVKRSLIIGRTLLRGWPLNRAGLLQHDIDYGLEASN